MDRLEELKQKYAGALAAVKAQGVALSHLHVRPRTSLASGSTRRFPGTSWLLCWARTCRALVWCPGRLERQSSRRTACGYAQILGSSTGSTQSPRLTRLQSGARQSNWFTA